MAINLVKGQRVDIGLSLLTVEMGWRLSPGQHFDLDASTFLLRANGEIGVEEDFVFYGSCKQREDANGNVRPVSADESVWGSVDELGEDDNYTEDCYEQIDVDLSKTSPEIQEIIFTASIYWAKGQPSEHYNFGQLRRAYILIRDRNTGEEICRYDLDEDFSTAKGVEFGRLYRRNGAWKFQAMGDASTLGLEPICRKYANKFMA